MPESGTVRVRSDERRGFRRVQVSLLGRWMHPDGSEHTCKVSDISPGGMAVETAAAAAVGQRIVAYVHQVGRLEGRVVRTSRTGFAMTIEATPRKREKLAAQLAWLSSDRPDARKHARTAPRNESTTFVMPGGTPVACAIIDMSLSGAAVASETKPPVGAVITLGTIQGMVTRINDDGFAVEFTRHQHADFLEQDITTA